MDRERNYLTSDTPGARVLDMSDILITTDADGLMDVWGPRNGTHLIRSGDPLRLAAAVVNAITDAPKSATRADIVEIALDRIQSGEDDGSMRRLIEQATGVNCGE